MITVTLMSDKYIFIYFITETEQKKYKTVKLKKNERRNFSGNRKQL